MIEFSLHDIFLKRRWLLVYPQSTILIGETARASREQIATPLLSNTNADQIKLTEKMDLNESHTIKSTTNTNADKSPKKDGLSWFELFRVLFPYFWPSAGTDGAIINRIRSTSTWLMVIPKDLYIWFVKVMHDFFFLPYAFHPRNLT